MHRALPKHPEHAGFEERESHEALQALRLDASARATGECIRNKELTLFEGIDLREASKQ
ncbi:hypothetical protein QLQ15_02200 [Lysobacter sp. LF1]|uniref:Uncharacterized protein n=1 Tax=Lysobacter stagni TaxID=3045172 RepID=A0ABT6XC52_9GAMM|nr:hypothetical protein [Lysobacter sp. LF1]MDI9237720.1 hypothetical protein [Lysobacter sp. LF1]